MFERIIYALVIGFVWFCFGAIIYKFIKNDTNWFNSALGMGTAAAVTTVITHN